jgi:hypothetical protein
MWFNGSKFVGELHSLRDFRDEYVMKTFAGWNFMILFNSLYYSVSPPVARAVAFSVDLKGLIQTFLSPELVILPLAQSVYLHVYMFDAELAVMLSGLVVTTLLGLVYLWPFPALLAWKSRSYRRVMFSKKASILRSAILFCLMGVVAAATLMKMPMLTALSTLLTGMAIMVYASLIPTWLWVKSKHH